MRLSGRASFSVNAQTFSDAVTDPLYTAEEPERPVQEWRCHAIDTYYLRSIFIGESAGEATERGRAMLLRIITSYEYQCERCGGVWPSHKPPADAPKRCTHCGSPFWNRPYARPQVAEKLRQTLAAKKTAQPP